MPSLQQFARALATAVAGTGAVSILPASGNAAVYRDISNIIITTPNAAAAVLTLSDGTKSYTFNYPNAAAAPTFPFEMVFEPPLQQTLPNTAWTLTASVNASGFNVTVQFIER